MSADDRIDGPENDLNDLYDETPPRSIFSTMWFRALLVLIVLAVVVAVAAPYILDATNPPTRPTLASRPQSAAEPSPPAVTSSPLGSSALTQGESAPPASAPSTPAPTTSAAPDRPPADKPVFPPPRKPLGGDTTASASRPAITARAASDKPAASEKPAVTEKAAALPTPAPVEKSTLSDKMDASASTDKKDTRMAARATTEPSAPRAATGGDWWVQVAAYRDEGEAKKLAARLREQNYSVAVPVKPSTADRSAPPASAASASKPDQYDVFISGTSAPDLNQRLASKGLTAEPSGNGVVVKPSLPLRDAVALSKDLATDGLKVQVRRAGSSGETTIPAAAKRPAPAATSGDPWYRVRIGAFPDHETAVTTLKELEAKGYKPFIARGGS